LVEVCVSCPEQVVVGVPKQMESLLALPRGISVTESLFEKKILALLAQLEANPLAKVTLEGVEEPLPCMT